MVENKLIVRAKNGLHARPAGMLVKEAAKFKSNIWIATEDKKVNAKSIMVVMSLGIRECQEISVIAEGEDEKEAVDAIVNLFESGFEE